MEDFLKLFSSNYLYKINLCGKCKIKYELSEFYGPKYVDYLRLYFMSHNKKFEFTIMEKQGYVIPVTNMYFYEVENFTIPIHLDLPKFPEIKYQIFNLCNKTDLQKFSGNFYNYNNQIKLSKFLQEDIDDLFDYNDTVVITDAFAIDFDEKILTFNKHDFKKCSESEFINTLNIIKYFNK